MRECEWASRGGEMIKTEYIMMAEHENEKRGTRNENENDRTIVEI
jgi:hypothetical protein